MAADQIAFTLAKRSIQEQSTLVIGARFRNRASVADAVPTNVKYRIDDLATGSQLLDWTSVTPAASVNITITALQNAIRNDANSIETKQLTVASDYGLSTQYIDRTTWDVRNLKGIR